MDRLNQLRGEAGTSGDSTLDTSSPPSEAYMSANESSSKYFSLSDVDSTFDISPIKDVPLPCASTATVESEKAVDDPDRLITNLSPISKKTDFLDTYKIGEQIEAANILSGGVAIFDDNDNSYDGDELVIDDNAEEVKVITDIEATVFDVLPEASVSDNVLTEIVISDTASDNFSPEAVIPDSISPIVAIPDNVRLITKASDKVSQETTISENIAPKTEYIAKVSSESVALSNVSPKATICKDISAKAVILDNALPKASLLDAVTPKAVVSENVVPKALVSDNVLSEALVPDIVSTDTAVPNNVAPEAASVGIESKSTEIILQIDGIKVDATHIGNGLYLFRRKGNKELEAVQIYNNQKEPSFQFLKVRENADKKLEVYEEIEVPNEMSATESKFINEGKRDDGHVLNEDMIKDSSNATCTNIFERKEVDCHLATAQNTLNNDQSNSKIDSLENIKKLGECKNTLLADSSNFSTITCHSTPTKDDRLTLAKAMVNVHLQFNKDSDNLQTIEVNSDNFKQEHLGNNKNTVEKYVGLEMHKAKDENLRKEKTIETKLVNECISTFNTNENKIVTESDIDGQLIAEQKPIDKVEDENQILENKDTCTDSNISLETSKNMALENKELIEKKSLKVCWKQSNDTLKVDNNYNTKLKEKKDVDGVNSSQFNENTSVLSKEAAFNSEKDNNFTLEKSQVLVKSDNKELDIKKGQNNKHILVVKDPVSITDLNVTCKKQGTHNTLDNYDSNTNQEKSQTLSTNVNTLDIENKSSCNLHTANISIPELSGNTVTKEIALLKDLNTNRENASEKSVDLESSRSIQADSCEASNKMNQAKLDANEEMCNKSLDKTEAKAEESKEEIEYRNKTPVVDNVTSIMKEQLKSLSQDTETQPSINSEIKSTNNQDSKPVTESKNNQNNDKTIDSKNTQKNISTDTERNNTNHVDVPFGKWTDANRQAFLSRFKETKVPSTSSNGKQIKNSNDLNRRDILKKIDSKRQTQTNVNTSKIQDFGSLSRLGAKKDASVFSCIPVSEDSTLSMKTETGLTDKLIPHTNVAHSDKSNTKIQSDNSLSKKEPAQRKEINNQELIDKTIEGIINRVVQIKSHEDNVHMASEETDLLHSKDIKSSNNELPKGLDDIEIKMNELHGIPFIERPPHELPHVSNVGMKTYSKMEIEKVSLKQSKIPNLIPFSKNQTKCVKECNIDIDSEEEVIEHEPITGDMEVVKKDDTVPTGNKVERLPHGDELSKTEGVITEKDFDKFYRRNSANCENAITLNVNKPQSPNMLHTVVQKDSILKTYSKNVHRDQHYKNKAIKQIQNKKVASIFSEESNKSIHHSTVKTAYHDVMTAKHHMERPVTIIEDKPVKVIFMNETTDFSSSLLNAQGKNLSPSKNQLINTDVITANDSLDSDVLEIQEDKFQDDSKTKVKHLRKQVLTPVEVSDLELIEPDDLRIDLSPKKKRKTDEGVEKCPKALVPKKSYLLGRSTVTDDTNKLCNMPDSFEKVSIIHDAHHKNTAAAIDSLVKAAELLETQSGNIISTQLESSESQSNTPVKRGRGRPRKYPLPDVPENNHNTPSPRKKPRLTTDIKNSKNIDSTDDDDESCDGEMIKENWTMGKINENIVCPICSKLFRSENVVFKHVKHCTGPSPSRSDSGNKSPRRLRESHDSETKLHDSKSVDMESDEDEMSHKKVTQKRKSRDSKPKSEDFQLKQKPEQRNELKTAQKSTCLKRSVSNLVCELCGKTFRQRSYLASHKIQHEKDEALKLETRNNSASSVFSCEICKKQFRKLHHLVQHRIIHNPTAGKFIRKSSVEQNDHKTSKDQKSRKQSDDASAGFRCEPCDKSFRKLHHLVEHRETHDCINRQKSSSNVPHTEKPSQPAPQCEICKKTFRKLHHLIEHKEQHYEASSEKSDSKSVRGSLSTKDIIHECSLCYMVFPNEHSLNKHFIICQKKKRQSAAKQEKQASEKNSNSEDLIVNKSDENVEKDIEILVADVKSFVTMHTSESLSETDPTIQQEIKCMDVTKDLPLSKEPLGDSTHNEEHNVKVKDTIIEKEIKECADLPNITKKIDEIDNKTINTPKEKRKYKKTPLKDKVAPTVTKHRPSNLNLPVIADTKPSESSDDDEVRYMLNPAYKVQKSNEQKVFMKVRANKRSSLQIERPNSKDLVKRRTSLQHPPKVPRVKTKFVNKVVPTNLPTSTKQVKPVKLDPLPSSDSDDSDVKYSFPKSVVEKTTKLKREEVSVKRQEKKPQRKSLVDKRKSLGNIAKQKFLGKMASANIKKKVIPSSLKTSRKRAEVEHRCDCGQLFSSVALLSRHTSVAHTPPRIRRRRSSVAAANTAAATNTISTPSTTTSTVSNTKKTISKARRNVPHKGVPVPEKMRKLMEKKK